MSRRRRHLFPNATGGAPPGDVTPPVLTLPTAVKTGVTTATLGVTTDEGNGILYVVVTISAVAPSKGQIVAGQNELGAAAPYASNQAIASTGAKTFSATGLSGSTVYYTYFVHQDTAGNQSNIAAASSFTTDAAVSPPIVANQAITFGRLTLVSAGNGIGDIISTGSAIASITLGTRTVGSNHFSAGTTLIPTSVPSDAQYVWTGCTAADAGAEVSAPFTLTINTTANAYSVAGRTQLEAVIALGAGTVTGKTVLCRNSGNYTGDGTRITCALTPAAVFTISAHTFTTNANPELMTWTVTLPGIDLNGASKVTVEKLALYRDWEAADASGGGVIEVPGSTQITISKCHVYSESLITAPMQGGGTGGVNYEMLKAVSNESVACTTLTVDSCFLEQVNYGVYASGTGTTVTANVILDVYTNFCELYGDSSTSLFQNNICEGVWANGTDSGNPHSSVFGATPGNVNVSGMQLLDNILLVGTRRHDLRGDKYGYATGPKFNDIDPSKDYSNILVKGCVICVNGNIGLEYFENNDSGAGGNTSQFDYNTLVIDPNTYPPSLQVPGLDYHNVGTAVYARYNTQHAAAESTTLLDTDSSYFVNSFNNVGSLSGNGSGFTAVAGDVAYYSALFDGPTFTGVTRSNVLTKFNPKAGGRLTRDSTPIGAIVSSALRGGVYPAITKPTPSVAAGVELQAVAFDGTADQSVCSKGADSSLLGMTTGDEFCLVFYLNVTSANSADTYWLTAAGTNLAVRRLPNSGIIRVTAKNSTPAQCLEFETSLKATSTDGPSVWVITGKFSTYEIWVSKNGVIDPHLNMKQCKGGAWNYNSSYLVLMGPVTGSSNRTAAEVYAFWMADKYFDLSVQATLDKFTCQDGRTPDWGADGKTLDASCKAYLTGAASAWNAVSPGFNLASATSTRKFLMTGAVADVTDAIAPTLTSPTGTQTGSSTATLGVTTNENDGTLYYVVATSAVAPTKAQVKLGQDNSSVAGAYSGNQAISTTGAKTASATGLASSTVYYTYFMHEDAAANQSSVSSASSFTTAAGAKQFMGIDSQTNESGSGREFAGIGSQINESA